MLTTGEMIDQLKVGEIAVVRDNLLSPDIKNLEDNVIFDGYMYHWDDGSRFQLNEVTAKIKWEITAKPPKYVSFEEAMKARKENKGIRFHPSHNSKIYVIPDSNLKFKDGWFANHTLDDLINGNWTIKEE